ncbi:MAG: hypothetical protein SFT81_05620 [Candidatus Caenarcaniphilales bacterium]|nr:hypothetical protein [Candidatus Caenarcaniphilales bacterium]
MSETDHQLYKAGLSQGKSKLIGFSYLSFGLGFGPFIPLVAACVFRKDRLLFIQLLQSLLFQVFFALIKLLIDTNLIVSLLKDPSLDISIEKVGSEIIGWVFCIVGFIASLLAFGRGYILIPVFHTLAKKLEEFFSTKSLRKAFALNSLIPGLGQLYLGKSWLGWILIACFIVTFFITLYLGIAFYKFAMAKDLLTFFGFFFRPSDQVMGANLSSPIYLGIFGGILLFIYAMSFLSLFSFRHRWNFPQRTIVGSAGVSYLFHLGALLVVLLIPIILNQAPQKSQLNNRAKEILKQLEKEKKKKEEQKKKTVKLPSIPPEKYSEKTREMSFDLAIPERIQGLNEFENKKYGAGKQKDQKPVVDYGERKEPLPPVQEAFQGRDYKSYSEFISAKIREGKRDQEIWEQVESEFYATVVEYTIEPNGHISHLRIVDPSDHMSTDALTLAVIESMSPMLSPPDGKRIHVTELFWNTHGEDGLDTELKRTLSKYPDGRVIEILE